MFCINNHLMITNRLDSVATDDKSFQGGRHSFWELVRQLAPSRGMTTPQTEGSARFLKIERAWFNCWEEEGWQEFCPAASKCRRAIHTGSKLLPNDIGNWKLLPNDIGNWQLLPNDIGNWQWKGDIANWLLPHCILGKNSNTTLATSFLQLSIAASERGNFILWMLVNLQIPNTRITHKIQKSLL